MTQAALGARIRELREMRGLTQAELAERAELSRIYVQSLERGARQSPTVAALEQIARALGVRLIVDFQAPKSERRGGRRGR